MAVQTRASESDEGAVSQPTSRMDGGEEQLHTCYEQNGHTNLDPLALVPLLGRHGVVLVCWGIGEPRAVEGC